ncbi:hypothetical protein PFTANZ_04056, partial [Plasmodium falciparum Tanzania (2000708)]
MNDNRILITDASKQCICVHLQHNVIGKHTKMAQGGSGGSPQDESAKHLLDSIGKKVHDQVQNEAKQRSNGDLKAYVSFASIFGVESASTTDPCDLIKEKRENLIGASGKRHPCGNVSGNDETGNDDSKRFSKESGGECDDKKIKGNKGKEGACAPYRRLSLCNKNFPNMNSNDSSKAKNDLLLDVCLAAKFEGESLINYRAQYDAEYPSSGSTFTMCTMLARSFADIGDIVRGRDLYLGKKKKNQTERDKLEQKLKEIFKQIHENLGTQEKIHYNDTTDYFQLREDWWAANRETVWKAMTCSDDLNNSSYFHATCDSGDGRGGAQARNQCRSLFKRWLEYFLEDYNKINDKISQCMNNGKGSTCINDCTNKCNCVNNWIKKKTLEWEKVRQRYINQYSANKLDNLYAVRSFLQQQPFHNDVQKAKGDFESLDVLEKSNDCTVSGPSENKNSTKKDVVECLLYKLQKKIDTYNTQTIEKKSKPPVDLLRVLNIPKGDYDIPTLKSSNRYIPYGTDKYRGKRYIYVEGDTDEDKYMFMSDTTDVTSSESEYEELDINEIYPYQSPKYKTLIEVVLEPSGNNTPTSDIPSDNTPTPQPITDDEWNQLKDDFITNMLQNTQNTEPNILGDNVDNNTHPTMSRDKLYQKPFIMSIHDRNLYTGEEYNYDMSNNIGNKDLYSGQNNVYDGIDPTSDNRDSYSDKNGSISDIHHPYSGIDLINDSLNSGNHPIDIYDEVLKRKENELFGTNHVKQTSTHSVAKNTNSDPVMNQLDLFHKWLDRHRDMCEKWDTNNKKEELLDKLKEEWNKDNNKHNGENTINKTLNTD